MEITEKIIPAKDEDRRWYSGDVFTLEGGDTLKIESDGVEHLIVIVPEGETRTFTINVVIED